MGDHPNAELARRWLEGFNAGDPEVFAAMLADDVVWHQIGGTTLNGKDAFLESLTGFEDVVFDLNLHDVVANDDHTVALVEVHVEAGGQTFDYRTTEIMHVTNGKVTERWAFSDDTQAIIDFFSQFE